MVDRKAQSRMTSPYRSLSITSGLLQNSKSIKHWTGGAVICAFTCQIDMPALHNSPTIGWYATWNRLIQLQVKITSPIQVLRGYRLCIIKSQMGKSWVTWANYKVRCYLDETGDFIKMVIKVIKSRTNWHKYTK